MATGFLTILLFTFILIGQAKAQEVIVAREKKPEAPKQAAPTPEQTEQTPSESPAPEPAKPKTRSRKSSAEPTLEEMRKAGALAAERLNSPSPSQKNRSAREEASEANPAPSPVVRETPRPPRKRETPSEQPSTSQRPSSRPGKSEAIGAVRSTFLESGRSEPSNTPPPKGQTPAP